LSRSRSLHRAALGALAEPHSDFIGGELVQPLGKRVLVVGRFRTAVCQAAFSLVRGSPIGYAAADCYARLRFVYRLRWNRLRRGGL
jgi:hypothetical protein